MEHMNKAENPFLNAGSPEPVARRQSDSSRTRKRTDSGVYEASRPEEAAKFEMALDEGHPLIARYQPRLAGKGGEHVVYDVAGSPDVVVKAEMKALADILMSEDESVALEYARGRLAEQRRLFTVLNRHFGAEHVLPQMKTLMKVPLTKGLAEEIEKRFGVKVPPGKTEAWTIVTVQRRTQEAEKETNKSFSSGGLVDDWYVRNLANPGIRDEYARNTDALMNAETAANTPFSYSEFAHFVGTSSLVDVLDDAELDTGLKEVVRDFCERAAAFAEETGEMLDIAGKGNIVFFKKDDGSWTYKLIDPFYGLDSRVLEKARFAYFQLDRGKDIDDDSKLDNALIQGVNFTRALNGAANVVGAKKFYDFLPAKGTEPPNVSGAIWQMRTGRKPIEKKESDRATKIYSSKKSTRQSEIVTKQDA